MSDPFVVDVVRSGFVESTHIVDVAVVDDAGLIARAGDPSVRCAFRSSAKPLQARVAVEAGWSPQDQRFLAIACASHNGEPEHVTTVRSLLAHAGVDESSLACPLDVPAGDAALAVQEKARIYHNCSGKHAGMLAACAAAGWPLDGYRSPDHPLQQRIAQMVSASTGEKNEVLIDGCGAPTAVASLAGFARAFLSIDGGPETAAMRAHPFLVAGTRRLDTALMSAAPDLVSKGGAEGLACATDGTVGIACKVRDGNARATGPVLIAVLAQLGLVSPDQRQELTSVERPAVLGGGEPVGGCTARGAISRVGVR
ncbi:MAG TPA: asparaginase [Actinomycetota bacterium]|nr:asparaginase [Actinomycetota bacterium]